MGRLLQHPDDDAEFQQVLKQIMVHDVAASDQPHYMFADRLEKFPASDPAAHHGSVNFLAHEDVALKAYFETRCRYLGSLPARRAFNQIGEALPTVVHNGLIIGTWSWDSSKERVSTSLVGGASTPQVCKAVRTRSDLLTKVLRRHWTSDRPGRAAGIRGQLSLLPEQGLA